MRPGPLGRSGEAYAETKYPETAGWHDLAALAFDQWKAIVSSESELYDLASILEKRATWRARSSPSSTARGGG